MVLGEKRKPVSANVEQPAFSATFKFQPHQFKRARERRFARCDIAAICKKRSDPSLDEGDFAVTCLFAPFLGDVWIWRAISGVFIVLQHLGREGEVKKLADSCELRFKI